MDVLAGLMTGQLGAMATLPGPTDDFYYGPIGAVSLSGIHVDAEGAKKLSAWFRGRDILATSLAMLPLMMFRRLPNDEGRDVASAHPLHDLLHRKPNVGQDAFTWKREAMYDLIDNGWAYADILEGPRGFADQLRPIPATHVTPERIKSGAFKGRWLFHVRDEVTGQTQTRTQDDIFYLRGVEGKGILDYARESLGLGRVLESYASKLFSAGAMNGGMLEPPAGPLNEEALKASARSWKTAMGDWHMPRILPPGTKFHPSTMEPEKAQFILSRKFTVNDIARWLGLPPHMIGDLDRATFTNIEHQGQEFVTYALGPWLSLWEYAINDQLVLAPDVYYAEFIRDALVRGDISTRWAAYVSSTNAGIQTRNEVRRKENLRALPGLDEPLNPANITGNQASTRRPVPPAPEADEDEAPPDSRARAIVRESAARVQRKEIAAASRAAVKFAADPDGFAAWATEFYEGHVALVCATLQVDEMVARLYCETQRDAVVAHGLAVTESWTPEYLVGVALDAPRPDPLLAAITRWSEKPTQIVVHAGRGDVRRDVVRDRATGLITSVREYGDASEAQ